MTIIEKRITSAGRFSLVTVCTSAPTKAHMFWIDRRKDHELRELLDNLDDQGLIELARLDQEYLKTWRIK